MLNVHFNVGTQEYNSIRDWCCYPKSFSIGQAKPKTNYVDVPFRDGALDITEAYCPVRYDNRTITIPMRIVNDEPLVIYDQVSNILSGRLCKIRLLDKESHATEYYYTGRVTVGELQTSKSAWDFELTMYAFPYKMKDVKLAVTSPTTLHINNDGAVVVPTIVNSGAITGTWNGDEFSLQAGTHEDAALKLVHGDNEVTFSGSATVQISYTVKRL